MAFSDEVKPRINKLSEIDFWSSFQSSTGQLPGGRVDILVRTHINDNNCPLRDGRESTLSSVIYRNNNVWHYYPGEGGKKWKHYCWFSSHSGRWEGELFEMSDDGFGILNELPRDTLMTCLLSSGTLQDFIKLVDIVTL